MKNIPQSSTETLISALRILARDIQSGDGAANAAIAEAADRLENLNVMVKLSIGQRWIDAGELYKYRVDLNKEYTVSWIKYSNIILNGYLELEEIPGFPYLKERFKKYEPGYVVYQYNDKLLVKAKNGVIKIYHYNLKEIK